MEETKEVVNKFEISGNFKSVEFKLKGNIEDILDIYKISQLIGIKK